MDNKPNKPSEPNEPDRITPHIPITVLAYKSPTIAKICLLAQIFDNEATEESLAASSCLWTLAGAIGEGGEPLEAFVEFCHQFTLNAMKRVATTGTAREEIGNL